MPQEETKRLSLSVGDVVEGLEPNEYVEIRRIIPFGSRFVVEGVGAQSRREIRRLLSESELANLRIIRSSGYTYNGDAEAFLLGVEAERIRIAYRFDPLFAVNSSVVDELPHQVEAVYRYLLPLPKIRFLLADDTGAGKTIMAGLLLKELLLRGVVHKVLIITPGGLTGQWQDEFKEKFGLELRLVNRASFEADPVQFARPDSGLFVVSMDFLARNKVCLNAARETQWDLIIVDEAHKLSAFEYGTRLERTERYKAVEALASRTDHLLFLTATPHRGRPDTFRRLLMLLDPDLFQRDDHVTRYIRGPGQRRFFLRRLKEEMVDWEGRPLFKPRYTRTIGYKLTPEELELYEAVTDYVRRYRKEAKARRNRNVELTLMILQRRLASSLYAITRTLERRVAAIEEALRILRDPARSTAEKRRLVWGDGVDDTPATIAEYEELDERQRQAVEERVSRYVLSDDPEVVERELEEVKELLRLAQSLRDHKEAKFEELLKVLDTSGVIRSENEKLLIFTEHKDTLDSLARRLEALGYSVVTIHGGMDIEARKQAQIEFHKRAKIMVATDAAGEGINLQFCRYLINWDIPWNPNRLEQRMGRIHRYGQRGNVWVFNLVALNTREGKVLEKVLSKLDIMRQQLGEDRVYDVIDELLEGVPLVELIERSIEVEDPETVEREVQRLVEGTRLEERASELTKRHKELAPVSQPDLRAARELRDRSDENRLHPLFIQNFFLRAYRAAGGRVEADPYYPVYRIVGQVPEALLQVARRRRINLAERYDRTPFVFDKSLLSVTSEISVPEGTRLLGPGHPLFETVCEWALERAQEAFIRGVTLVDPNVKDPQRIWLVRSCIRDARRGELSQPVHEELAVIVEDKNGLRKVSPGYLLNCVPPEGPVSQPEFPTRPLEEIQRWVYEHLTEPQLERVCQEREAEVARRREYLETTFTELILDLQEKLNDLYQAQMFGQDDPDERRRLEKRLQELKKRKRERLEELELMRQLFADLPEVIASAMIVPAAVAIAEEKDESRVIRQGVPMRRDDEVERIAMEVAMYYERSRGWVPEDVSQEGLHYDIRSVGPNGEKRFIEVKGRAHTGPIVLTAPEADKLRQLGERAYLYIVTFCKGEKPRLRIIQNPMAYLTPEVLYRQVQFLVEEEDWAKFGEEVEVA